MARFDVHKIGDRTRVRVVDVQADILSYLATRVVVPLQPVARSPAPLCDLNPVLAIDGEDYVLLPQAIAALPVRDLKSSVTSLAVEGDRILRALDTLLKGF